MVARDTETDARKKARATARRAAKRGYTLEGEGVACALCGHTAHSLVSHIRMTHGLDATSYEEKAGLALGTAVLVSPSLAARLAQAGKKGADALAAKRAAS